MYDLKKTVLSSEDYFRGEADDAHDIAILTRDDNRALKLGVFPLKGTGASVAVSFPDGTYCNRITGESVQVSGGHLVCRGEPILLCREI